MRNINRHFKNVPPLASNLLKQMKKHEISEAELARQTNIPQSTLHKILTGKTEDPRFSTLQQLASFFGLTIDEFMRGSANAGSYKGLTNGAIMSIPIISWRDCARDLSFVAKLSIKKWKDWVAVEHLSVGSFGVLSTPSAEPRFPRGTIMIVDPHIVPKDGDLLIIKQQDAEEAALRELSVDGGRKILLPVNTNFAASEMNDMVSIVGVVAEYRFWCHSA